MRWRDLSKEERRAARKRLREEVFRFQGAVRWRAEPGSRLAKLRMECHRRLDSRWEFGGMTRSDAYAWLAEEMGIFRGVCHIGMFDEIQCEMALAVLTRAVEG